MFIAMNFPVAIWAGIRADGAQQELAGFFGDLAGVRIARGRIGKR